MVINFAALEETMAGYLGYLLHDYAQSTAEIKSDPSWERKLRADKLPSQFSFDEKRNLFKQFTHVLSVTDSKEKQALLAILGSMKVLAEDRSNIIHGWLDWEGDGPVFVRKGVTSPATKTQINDVDERIRDVNGTFPRALMDFLMSGTVRNA